MYQEWIHQGYTNIVVLIYLLTIQPSYMQAFIYKKCPANSHTVAVLVDSNRSCMHAHTSGVGVPQWCSNLLLSFTSQYILQMQKFTRSAQQILTHQQLLLLFGIFDWQERIIEAAWACMHKEYLHLNAIFTHGKVTWNAQQVLIQ
jgi:hypothetical protein